MPLDAASLMRTGPDAGCAACAVYAIYHHIFAAHIACLCSRHLLFIQTLPMTAGDAAA